MAKENPGVGRNPPNNLLMSKSRKKEQAGEYETDARAEYHTIMFIKDPTQRRAALSGFFVKLYALIQAFDFQHDTDYAQAFRTQKDILISNEIEYDQQEIANEIGWELIDDRYNIHVPATVNSLARAHKIFENLQDRSINEAFFDLIGEMLAFLEMTHIFSYQRKTDADRYRMMIHQRMNDDDDDDTDDDDNERD